MGTPAPGQARRQHDGKFNDVAQLPVVFDRFRTVCRMRSPTQVSVLRKPIFADGCTRDIYCTMPLKIHNY